MHESDGAHDEAGEAARAKAASAAAAAAWATALASATAACAATATAAALSAPDPVGTRADKALKAAVASVGAATLAWSAAMASSTTAWVNALLARKSLDAARVAKKAAAFAGKKADKATLSMAEMGEATATVASWSVASNLAALADSDAAAACETAITTDNQALAWAEAVGHVRHW